MAIEKIRCLDDAYARWLLAWLDAQERKESREPAPLGAMAMRGFARRFHAQPRTTDEWMAELRAGEHN